MLVYYFVPFIVSNRYLLFRDSNGHNSVTVQNRTHVYEYMNFFDHKDLGNHLLQLCPKVVKHPVYIYIYCLACSLFVSHVLSLLLSCLVCNCCWFGCMYCCICLVWVLLSYVYLLYCVCIAVSVLYMPDCWLEVSIRKVLRPATS